jgi:hypothetical protein
VQDERVLVATARREVSMRSLPNATLLSCVFLLLGPNVTASLDDGQTTTLASVFNREKVLAVTPWRVTGGRMFCVISQRDRSTGPDSPLSTKVMTVYSEEGTKLTQIFAFETPDTVMNMYPLDDYNGRLFVTWVGGSAYHFRVFAYLDGKVQQVLDVGSRGFPEFQIDEKGNESILITDERLENGVWTPVHGTTEIYRWNRKRYDKLGAVPWAKRFQCVSRESCALLK